MSFAGSVKEELLKHTGASRHCRLAELAALMSYGSREYPENDETGMLRLDFDNDAIAEKCFTLIVKTFNISKNATDVM